MTSLPDPQLTDDDEKYRAPALAKGLDILELLASTPDGLTQVEVAKALGLKVSIQPGTSILPMMAFQVGKPIHSSRGAV